MTLLVGTNIHHRTRLRLLRLPYLPHQIERSQSVDLVTASGVFRQETLTEPGSELETMVLAFAMGAVPVSVA
jgi:hypothetical protein